MKRRVLSIITLSLIIGAALFIASDQAADAQGQMRPVADSGVITLGPNQVLRVTVAAGDVNGDDSIRVRFRQTQYIEQGNVYRIISQTTSPAITLAPNEAAVVDAADYVVWRTVVLSNRPNARVTSIVFDTSTQRVVSIISDKATPVL